MSKATNKFAPEVRERAVCMGLEREGDHPSRWAAITWGRADLPGSADRPHPPTTSTSRSDVIIHGYRPAFSVIRL